MKSPPLQMFILCVSLCSIFGCTSDAETSQSLASAGAQVDTESNDSQASTDKPKSTAMNGMGGMKFPASADMKFKDGVDSNVELPESVGDLVFTNKDGSELKVADYRGKQNLILVFTEGFNGMLCPFCKTQTSRLVANYEKFKQRNCEVIVVYPGPVDRLDDFVEAALTTEKIQVDKVPFPIVLDKDFSATKFFAIQSRHAHPSTYLVDKEGNVKFAYVGQDMTADRPSIKTMLDKLDRLQ